MNVPACGVADEAIAPGEDGRVSQAEPAASPQADKSDKLSVFSRALLKIRR
jgi:hypothetical protein